MAGSSDARWELRTHGDPRIIKLALDLTDEERRDPKRSWVNHVLPFHAPPVPAKFAPPDDQDDGSEREAPKQTDDEDSWKDLDLEFFKKHAPPPRA
ncbi:hypothetical protein HK097_009508 [Rhizophlyctis rosea]|uniref:Anaphase-promoting complex subunit 13 n=1 Tax=Rhizophlyctis rosea TaxID=64517 RepID=A0AAD5S8V9_9FUNG|nr:hypothetical protein HK097_009508 [Rhizophlyctis rosea]